MEYLDVVFQYFGYEGFRDFALWVAKNPYEFLVTIMIILTPMFIISGILAFYLMKAIEKDEKEKKKREKRLKNMKADKNDKDKPKDKNKPHDKKGKKAKKID